MATKKRNIVTKVVVFVLFGLLIVSFVTWGVGDILRTPSRVVAVAEVGETKIDEREFRRNLTREINRLSARLGSRLDIEQARSLGIVDQVLGQMIGRALFDQKARELGMVVTKEQIGRRISEEPAFLDDLGKFDKSRFAQALQISNLGEQEYVDSLTRDIIRQQLANAVTGAVVAPKALAEAMFRYQQERRVAEYITVPTSSFTDLPAPDEASLEAIHKESSAKFMAPEFRQLTIVQLRAEDLAAEVSVSEADLQAEYDSRRDDFAVAERRQIEQMVFADEAAAQQAEGQLKQGINFATVAESLTGQAPVELGDVEKNDLPPELAEAAFAAAPDTVTAPVRSDLGWHILRVIAVTPGREPSFADVRAELAQDVGMRLAVDSMVSIANQLDDKLGAGTSLEEAAGALNLKQRRIDAVDRQGKAPDGTAIPDLPSDPFLETAFATAAGTDSLLTEANDGGYFVLRADAVTEARLRPLAEVRDQVVAAWQAQQRTKLAEEKATALAERLRGGATPEAVAAEAGLPIAKTEPLTRFDGRAPSSPSAALPGKLFQIQVGEVTTAKSETGEVVAKLSEIIAADPAKTPDDLADVQDGVAAALRSDLLEQFVASLRARIGVTINQRQVDNTLANF